MKNSELSKEDKVNMEFGRLSSEHDQLEKEYAAVGKRLKEYLEEIANFLSIFNKNDLEITIVDVDNGRIQIKDHMFNVTYPKRNDVFNAIEEKSKIRKRKSDIKTAISKIRKDRDPEKK